MHQARHRLLVRLQRPGARPRGADARASQHFSGKAVEASGAGLLGDDHGKRLENDQNDIKMVVSRPETQAFHGRFAEHASQKTAGAHWWCVGPIRLVARVLDQLFLLHNQVPQPQTAWLERPNRVETMKMSQHLLLLALHTYFHLFVQLLFPIQVRFRVLPHFDCSLPHFRASLSELELLAGLCRAPAARFGEPYANGTFSEVGPDDHPNSPHTQLNS